MWWKNDTLGILKCSEEIKYTSGISRHEEIRYKLQIPSYQN